MKKAPPYLRKGDEIAIISPSFCIEEKKLEEAAGIIESWGLKVRTGRNALRQHGPFAGTDSERLADLNEATADPSVRAVICSRGGYGLSRIIDRADFSPLAVSPKWYAGFSDITVLHLWLSEVCGLMSVHGEMPLNFTNPEKSGRSIRSLKKALFGNPEPVSWKGACYREAEASGEVTGGNLSLVCGLTGTAAEPGTRGKILFLEDVGESYYHIDRMFTALRLAGKLEGLAALVVGGMNRMEDTKIPWAETLEATIFSAVQGYGYPVFFGFPAGHIADNRSVYIGRDARIELSGRKAVIEYV
jgi:muramoyltetrapeptide carboxypeptidase